MLVSPRHDLKGLGDTLTRGESQPPRAGIAGAAGLVAAGALPWQAARGGFHEPRAERLLDDEKPTPLIGRDVV
jgi:hypothetical protein